MWRSRFMFRCLWFSARFSFCGVRQRFGVAKQNVSKKRSKVTARYKNCQNPSLFFAYWQQNRAFCKESKRKTSSVAQSSAFSLKANASALSAPNSAFSSSTSAVSFLNLTSRYSVGYSVGCKYWCKFAPEM